VTFVWARTFPDSRHDFVAEDAGQHVGRIRRIAGGPQNGIWFWRCTGCQRLPDESPYDEAKAGEFEVRRSMAMRNARPC
jgi:hypothetical protein